MSIGFLDASYMIFLIRHTEADFRDDGADSPMYMGSSSESYSIVVISSTVSGSSDMSMETFGSVDTKNDTGVGEVVIIYIYSNGDMIFAMPIILRSPNSPILISMFSSAVIYR